MSSSDAPDRGDITELLAEASHGNREAFDRLFPLVYDELKSLAGAKLRMERDGHTLNATALVHEAYLKLVRQERVEWQSRSHFFALAARAMRRILINHAKARTRDKRGGGRPHVPLEGEEQAAIPDELFTDDQATELLALDQALERLEEFNPRGADVVQYRFFGGLQYEEIAEVTGVSEVTVRRRWAAARVWLRSQLDPDIVDRAGVLVGGGPA